MDEPTAPVISDPVEELEGRFRTEAVTSAKKTLADLVPLLDPESKTVQRVLRLIKTTTDIYAQLIRSFSGDIIVRRGYSDGNVMPSVNEGINEGINEGTQVLMNPMSQGMDNETFGAQAIGQMIGLGKSLLSSNNNPSREIRDLSEALAIATEAGLPQAVRSGIEKKLTQALGGDKTSDPREAVEKLIKEAQ